MRTPLLLATLVTLGVSAAPRLADACSLFQNVDYLITPSSDDQVPPGAVTVTDVAVERSWAMENGSCPDLGAISFAVAATDDQPGIAYEVEVFSGTPPRNFDLPPGPAAPGVLGKFVFYFNPFDAVDIELAVRAIDFSGNRGEPTIFRVTSPAGVRPDDDDSFPGDDIADTGGCSTTGSPPLAAALALLALRRRRLTNATAPRK